MMWINDIAAGLGVYLREEKSDIWLTPCSPSPTIPPQWPIKHPPSEKGQTSK